ncbi:MAG: TRAP transporter small permease [Alphaproteobacteria bacterium]|jgi:C4-dicarboxylate transporter, DctQ subunit|nr:TRAP transporter small permease [Alphaproteobacteria bacterium]MBT4086495.1 TRAP transporter small permease [Alphaproteobacteria bacterium]MBT4546475.1 TRAP transporter small permease [Alphaproteobacteria bacterium]MBT7745476.1 TRAP transporter small permease [Alphaproteobacteria bacterium]
MTDAGNDTADSMLVAFDRWLIPVENLFNLIAGLFIFGLMILGIFQVIGRQVFNIPVAGYIDWVEVSMAVFAFMGAAYCQRTGTHVRMELFLTKVRLRTRWSMEIMGTIGAMIIISVLIIYGYDHTMRAFTIGDSTIDAELPMWPSKAVVPIAFSLLWLRLFVQLLGFMRLFRNPEAKPVAVPVVESVEEQAVHEIEDALVDGEVK